MTSQDWFSKDFYKTLGVPKDADEATIKKAYRKQAKELHPDRNPGNASAEKRFKDVGEAYAVLSDKTQREQYDSVRAMGGGPRFQAGGQGGGGFEDAMGGMFGGGRTQSGSFGGGRAQTGGGFEDILSSMFGGGRRGPTPGQDVGATTEVAFRQAADGATISLTLDGHKFSTRLPVGVKDGQKIRIRGKGRPGQNGGPPGDLMLTVRVAKHPVFTVDGNNLRLTLPVAFDEAVLGANVEVPTLDGTRVKVKVPSGTNSGRVLRVKGRGLNGATGTGDLLATVSVTVPGKVSRAAKEALQAFALETAKDDPRGDLYKDAVK
ncbi:DnaJ C-terminal domain-containing protein [Demequina aurantiaca]|uniref:DnaJ C-terminal domain-containing protein n=1 Tax=Demequina aurantiaca TaxID=676200 RepID=UPI0007844872|nr:DnaJ C-terminal domain-containing protein [Demequina aurantiaca]